MDAYASRASSVPEDSEFLPDLKIEDLLVENKAAQSNTVQGPPDADAMPDKSKVTAK